MNPEAYPLQWPAVRPRWSGQRERSQFKMNASAMIGHLHDELDRIGATDAIISSNKKPYSRSEAEFLDDPGVAVYFKRKGSDIALACDKYAKISDNLHAIGLAIEAFRSLERHATGDMVDAAFTGFKALPDAIVTPPPADNRPHRDWWIVLGVARDANVHEVKSAYRQALSISHPDAGGSQSDFTEVKNAYDEWKQA